MILRSVCLLALGLLVLGYASALPLHQDSKIEDGPDTNEEQTTLKSLEEDEDDLKSADDDDDDISDSTDKKDELAEGSGKKSSLAEASESDDEDESAEATKKEEVADEPAKDKDSESAEKSPSKADAAADKESEKETEPKKSPQVTAQNAPVKAKKETEKVAASTPIATATIEPKKAGSKRWGGGGGGEGMGHEMGHHGEHGHHEHGHDHHDHGYEFYEEYGEHGGHEGHHGGEHGGHQSGHEGGGGGYGGGGGGGGGHGGHGGHGEHGHEEEHEHEGHHHGHHAGYHHEWGHDEGGEHGGHGGHHEQGHEDHHGGMGGYGGGGGGYGGGGGGEGGGGYGGGGGGYGWGGGGYKSRISKAKSGKLKHDKSKLTLAKVAKKGTGYRWGNYWISNKNDLNSNKRNGNLDTMENPSSKGDKKWWLVGDHWGGWGWDHWGHPHQVGHGNGGWEYGHTGLHGGGHHRNNIPQTGTDCSEATNSDSYKRCLHGHITTHEHGGHAGHGGYHFYDHGHGHDDHDHHIQGPWTFGYDHWGDDYSDWDHNHHNFEHLQQMEHRSGGHHGFGGHHGGYGGGGGGYGGGGGGYGGGGGGHHGGFEGGMGGHHGGMGGGGGGHHGGFGGHHGGFGGGHHGGYGGHGGGGGGYGGGGGGYGGGGGGGYGRSLQQHSVPASQRISNMMHGKHQKGKDGNKRWVAYGNGIAVNPGYNCPLNQVCQGHVGVGAAPGCMNGVGHGCGGCGLDHAGGFGCYGLGSPGGVQYAGGQHGLVQGAVAGQAALHRDWFGPIVLPARSHHQGVQHGLQPAMHPVALSSGCHNFIFRNKVPRGMMRNDIARRCGVEINRQPIGGWYGWGGWPWGAYGDFHGYGGYNGVNGWQDCGQMLGHGSGGGCGGGSGNHGFGLFRGMIPRVHGKAHTRTVVDPYVGYGPWASYPWWADWWGGHGHHGWGSRGVGNAGYGHGQGRANTHPASKVGWHCHDVVEKANHVKTQKSTKRFCVPIGYHGGYGWPYWHGYPGVGLGLYGWGWPWYKSKVPKGSNQTEPVTNSTKDAPASVEGKKEDAPPSSDAKDVKGTQRDKIPSASSTEKPEKKQTIHVGYGYASGDNYRLGYGFGGMGGVSGFQGVGGSGGQSPVSRSRIPKTSKSADEKPADAVKETIPKPQPTIEVRASKRHFGGGGGGGQDMQHFPGYGFATPYGHPVTHPGFTTIGFPGHALTTSDIKDKIPHLPEKVKTKRQAYGPQENFVPFAPAMSDPRPAMLYPSVHAPEMMPQPSITGYTRGFIPQPMYVPDMGPRPFMPQHQVESYMSPYGYEGKRSMIPMAEEYEY